MIQSQQQNNVSFFFVVNFEKISDVLSIIDWKQVNAVIVNATG